MPLQNFEHPPFNQLIPCRTNMAEIEKTVLLIAIEDIRQIKKIGLPNRAEQVIGDAHEFPHAGMALLLQPLRMPFVPRHRFVSGEKRGLPEKKTAEPTVSAQQLYYFHVLEVVLVCNPGHGGNLFRR